jgi:hypothetical protein
MSSYEKVTTPFFFLKTGDEVEVSIEDPILSGILLFIPIQKFQKFGLLLLSLRTLDIGDEAIHICANEMKER